MINNATVTAKLTWVDGTAATFRLPPGYLSYDPRSGLVTAFSLSTKSGGVDHFILLENSPRYNNLIDLIEKHLAPLGLEILTDGVFDGDGIVDLVAPYVLKMHAEPFMRRIFAAMKDLSLSYYDMRTGERVFANPILLE